MGDESKPVERRRPLYIMAIAILFGASAVACFGGGVFLSLRPEQGSIDRLQFILAGLLISALAVVLARGLWYLRNWARTAALALSSVAIFIITVTILFDVATEIFAGESVKPIAEILIALGVGLVNFCQYAIVPGFVLYGLVRYGSEFEETHQQRMFADRSIRYILVATALSAIFIVFLIILFTLIEAWPSIQEIGLDNMLTGTIWRPGYIIGQEEEGQYGLIPMIAGSVLSTFGAAALGVPLSVLTAILLAEVAPPVVREIVRPAIELLAGIPSVVYGLFGMVVLAPLIRKIPVSHNTGFGLLNASIVLAVMIIPTVTNISEDAIRAVPKSYKEGSLALGATHWQTIRSVILPAARSGLVAAVILGIGRALGETMAMIMVIGNSIAIPGPLSNNPLTLFLNTARTLTGNIAVEINYAAGAHRSALFFTGVMLFGMILLVNSLARFLMRERMTT